MTSSINPSTPKLRRDSPEQQIIGIMEDVAYSFTEAPQCWLPEGRQGFHPPQEIIYDIQILEKEMIT